MAYGYYRTVTTDHAQCGGSDSLNYTILVNITNNDFKLVSNGGLIYNTALSNAQTVCADLAFYSSLGPSGLLNFEIDFYDGTLGQVIARVKIPVLSHTVDELIYCYYSDIAVSAFQGNVPNTWNNDYLGVWHLPNGSALSVRDSTINGNNGTNHNAVAPTTGQINGGAVFDGQHTAQYLSVTAAFGGVTALTISFWCFGPGTAGPFEGIISKGISGFSDFIIFNSVGLAFNKIGFYFQNSIGGNTGNVDTTVVIFDNTWHHFVLTWDGSLIRTYIDGVADVTASLTGTLNNSDPTIAFGAYSTPTNYFDGGLDDIIFCDIAQSADWVTQNYNNQKTSSTFITLGPQVPVIPPPPVVDMAYTQALQLGLSTTILQNIVYALPARACFVQSSAAVEVSNIIDTGFVALTNANTVGAETAATWLRCTTGNCVVSCKSL